MLIQVRLLHCAVKVFTYSVPQELQSKISCGLFVQVPLQQRVVPAVVDSFVDDSVKHAFAIKPIKSIYLFPQDAKYHAFIAKVAAYYQIDELSLFKRVQSFLQDKEKKVATQNQEDIQEQKEIIFTQEQQIAYDGIAPFVKCAKQETFVLHGVTGSGKTEVYKKLIEDALDKGKVALVMLPEVTLALQFEKIFAQSFGADNVIGFHSGSTIKHKRTLWNFLVNKKPIVVVGVHLPVLLPVANLGLIIIDEEHDTGYQEKKHPKINSRDMLLLKASMYQVPIVLGSATPSMQSLWNVKQRGWKLLTMKQRFTGKFPQVEIVSLKQKAKRKQFWITQPLHEHIQDRLIKKEQIIIFLNRRGYSFFVQCSCGFVFSCAHCSVSLTLHADNSLTCHYCGHKEQLPEHCSSCSLHHSNFIKKGVGTQQIVQILQKLYPQAVIARADADTTVKKKSWQQTVQDMLSGDINILVGTQSITKGYHFPGVTLVGVLWADLNLHFPVYNAAENALQQLIQVAGRAGRQTLESKVIIQTFDDHQVYDFIDETKYPQFYEQEIAKRLEVGYPPCSHIAEIEIRHADQQTVEQDAQKVAHQLQQYLDTKKWDINILGPVQAMVYRVKAVFAQKIILKSVSRIEMIQLFHSLQKDCVQSSLFFTIDPV